MYFLARTYFYSIYTLQTNKFIATVYLKLYCFILNSKLTRNVFWNPSSGSTSDLESRSWVRLLFCPCRSTYSIFIVQYTNNIYNLNTIILKIWFISIQFDFTFINPIDKYFILKNILGERSTETIEQSKSLNRTAQQSHNFRNKNPYKNISILITTPFFQ